MENENNPESEAAAAEPQGETSAPQDKTEPSSAEVAPPSEPEKIPDAAEAGTPDIAPQAAPAVEQEPLPKKDASEVMKTEKSSEDKKELKEKVESTLKASGSTFRQRSSLLYKHEFSAISLAKDGEPKADEDGKKALGSRGRLALGSVISIHRGSLTGDIYDKSKAARYMNTYRLESENPFNSEKVEKILEAVVMEALENLTYDQDKCAKQAKWASSAIRAAVKDMKFDRYKLVCLMTIGEKTSQDVYATCRFLWDVEKDRYAVFAHENTFVYGYAQCFGLYYE